MGPALLFRAAIVALLARIRAQPGQDGESASVSLTLRTVTFSSSLAEACDEDRSIPAARSSRLRVIWLNPPQLARWLMLLYPETGTPFPNKGKPAVRWGRKATDQAVKPDGRVTQKGRDVTP